LEQLGEMQQSVGTDAKLLDRADMAALWPSLNVSDLDGGLYSAMAGAIDPHAALMGFRSAARALGVTFLQDRVVDIVHDGLKAQGVVLESEEKIAAEMIVNAANCWAPDICAMVGMKVPIEPLRRQTFFFDCQTSIEPVPVIRDQSGFSIRPEGHGYLSGKTDFGQAAGFNWDLDYNVFDEELWPRLAHRYQAFEAIKVKSGWVGHYDLNSLDGNPILGPWVGGMENFYIAAGFSGHGLQHGPAIGRGMAEMLLEGQYRTIDLSVFSYQRALDYKPIIDCGPWHNEARISVGRGAGSNAGREIAPVDNIVVVFNTNIW